MLLPHIWRQFQPGRGSQGGCGRQGWSPLLKPPCSSTQLPPSLRAPPCGRQRPCSHAACPSGSASLGSVRAEGITGPLVALSVLRPVGAVPSNHRARGCGHFLCPCAVGEPRACFLHGVLPGPRPERVLSPQCSQLLPGQSTWGRLLQLPLRPERDLGPAAGRRVRREGRLGAAGRRVRRRQPQGSRPSRPSSPQPVCWWPGSCRVFLSV